MSKVIILEDSRVMAEYCSEMLKKAGYQTASTPSVKGAKALIEKSVSEDIILADYELEDGNCIDVMDWMTIMGYENPVVVMTAHNRLDYGATAISRGAQCCILKMILDEKLLLTSEKNVKSRNCLIIRYAFSDLGDSEIFMRNRTPYPPTRTS